MAAKRQKKQLHVVTLWITTMDGRTQRTYSDPMKEEDAAAPRREYQLMGHRAESNPTTAPKRRRRSSKVLEKATIPMFGEEIAVKPKRKRKALHQEGT